MAETPRRGALLPAQPDDGVRRPRVMTKLVAFAKEHEVVLVHDFAYADSASTGTNRRRSPGAGRQGRRRRALHPHQVLLHGRVARGFLVGNAEIVGALTKLKSYLDYGTFQPIQIAATVAMNEAPEYRGRSTTSTSTAVTCCATAAPHWLGGDPPKGTMFVWAPIPEPYREMGSLEFAKFLCARQTSPPRRESASGRAVTGTCASR